MTDIHTAAPSPGTKDTPTKRKRKAVQTEFPNRLNLNITEAMSASLQRLHKRLRLKEAVIGRLAIMNYLAAHDQQYRED